MQTISNEYKEIIENKLSFSPKCKIVVDGVEYLGDVIKTAPKFSHVSDKLFGTFSCKTCSFEIYNYLNNIDFENKEITIYKGIDISGNMEWVKQGIFIPKPDDITNNITTKVMSFSNVKDRTQLLDDKYESDLDWSNGQTHTGLEIIEEICNKKSIILKSRNFSWASIQMKQPNFTENTTNREAIARMGEIGGEISLFDNDGQLEIKSQYNTGDLIPRKRYEKLSKEKQFIINTVVLGNDGMDNDIVYPYTIENERSEYKILDNPYVDLYKEEMIEEVASHIIGKSYTPFTLEGFVDGFFYELNDKVTVEDKNGDIFDAVFLGYSNTSRIKSTFKAEVMSQDKTNYNLAGSNKQIFDKIVKLEVNHIEGRIDSVVSATETASSKANDAYSIANSTNNDLQKYKESVSTEFSQTKDTFDFRFNKVTDLIDKVSDTEGEHYSELHKYIRFVNGTIILGEEGNPLTAELSNNKLSFKQNGTEVAYISNNKLYITDSEILTNLTIGNFGFIPRNNGSLSFRKVK